MAFLAQHSFLVIILVGLVAGWGAGLIVRGRGFGIIGNLVIGIVGAFVGSWLLVTLLHVDLGAGIISSIAGSVIGAVVLLVAIKLIRRV